MEKILVVDDEPGVLSLCQKVLERDSYSVFTSSSGEEALALLGKEIFDLVLTDLRLTGMTGIDLIKKIKELHPQTEVIIITGQATVETAIEALKSGAYDYISKPFNISELTNSVKKALDFSRLRRQENIFRETTYLYKLSQEMTKSRTESEILKFILERAVKILNADAGSIFIFQQSSAMLVPMAVYGQEIFDEVRIGDGIAGWVAEKKQPLLIQDGLLDYPEFKDLPKRHELVSSLVVPLIEKEVLMGVICLNRYERLTNYQFTPKDLESIQVFAMHATLILSGSRHHAGLKELDKLKSEFVANVSHELRTPLMAISGAMELLNTYLGEQRNERKMNVILDLVARNTERMGRLVNDLLDFSRLESRQMRIEVTNFLIGDLLKETIQDVSFKAKEKDITVELTDSEEIEISADKDKIKQIILNLVGNALKFTPEKGFIKIGYSLQNENDILITVSDTGIGIPKDKQEKIFDKFYQVDGSISRLHSGFGLGLAIVKNTVEQHNGKIWVESEPDKGSKFFVLIPKNPKENTSNIEKETTMP